VRGRELSKGREVSLRGGMGTKLGEGMRAMFGEDYLKAILDERMRVKLGEGRGS
jgi:hypothetical protein